MASGKKHRKKSRKKSLGFVSAFSGTIWVPIAAAIIAAAVVVFVFKVVSENNINTEYNGLSESEVPEMNIYINTGFKKKKNGLLKYDDPFYTSSAGIDVSTYQKEIDWEKVKKSGISFVMIRAGYRTSDKGTIHKDKRFDDNYEGAKKAGLKIGVYFFSEAVRGYRTHRSSCRREGRR